MQDGKSFWPPSQQRGWARTGQAFSSSFPLKAERLKQTTLWPGSEMCRESWLWVLHLREGSYSSLRLQSKGTFSKGWQGNKWEEHSGRAIYLFVTGCTVKKTGVGGFYLAELWNLAWSPSTITTKSTELVFWMWSKTLPHLISVCNRITITSDDNTKVTNDCDLIKRARRLPPAD